MEELNKTQTIRVAIPVSNGRLCPHFGHCEAFALVDADPQVKNIVGSSLVSSPGHQPGMLPPWLHQQGVNVIITGGMGARAVEMFRQFGIRVIMGVPEDTPERIVQSYLKGSLITGENVCDHDEPHGPGGHQCRH